ncbi:hypothetical protein ACWF94_01955 [Streptomyces sp. NPDC055078]
MRRTLFRQLVEQRKWSVYEVFNGHYARVARELGATPGSGNLKYAFVIPRTFERWMNGDLKALPHRHARMILERLFSVPAEELFASVKDPASPSPAPAAGASGEPSLPPGPAGLSPRQETLSVTGLGGEHLTAAGLPFGYGLSPSAPDRLAQVAATGGDVQVIRSMLTSLTASDHQFGGGHARSYATDYLLRVVQPRLHSAMSTAVREELFQTAAEFAVRVAWMHFDVGQTRDSGRFLALALAAAQELDDPTLVGWVLSMRGLQSIWAGDVDRALSYTDGASGLAGRAPWKARAFITGKAALATSLTGDQAATLALLGQVRGFLEKAGGSGEPAWSEIYDLAYLRDEEGNCYRNLGMGQQAAEAEGDALRLRGEGKNGYARLRAFSMAVQAIGYLQAGSVEQGCAVGTQLVGLLPAFASHRVRRRLNDVLTAAQPYADQPAVRDLYEVARPALRASGPGAPHGP